MSSPTVARVTPSPSGAVSTGRYRPLDGLRAFAVLGVLAFHTDGRWLPGGFLGVDVFFVLSGYLMTGLLLRPDGRALRTSLPAFWLRRARRLAPALLVMTLGVVVVEGYLSSGGSAALPAQTAAALFYVTNWFALTDGTQYFQSWSDPSPLLQTWSLGIEEQFYLFFPVLLWAALRVRRTRSWLALLLALLAAGSAALAWYERQEPMRVYLGTDTRVQALLVGAILGLFVARPAKVGNGPPRGLRQAVGWASLLGLTAAVLLTAPWYDRMPVLVLTLVAVLTSGLMWALLDTADSRLARLFGNRVAVWIGGVSYALYLWHWPVFLWVQGRVDAGLGAQVWSIAVSVALAWASTRWVERPIRTGRFTALSVPRQWAVYGAATGVVLALSLLASSSAVGTPPAESQWPGAAGLPHSLALFGDSTAYTTVVGFPKQRYPGIRLSTVTPLGCGLRDRRLQRPDLDAAKPECDGWQQRWADVMQRERPEATVLMEGVWEMYDVIDADGAHAPGSDVYTREVTRAIEEAVDIISPQGGSAVYLVGVPCHGATHPFYAPTLNDKQRQAGLDAILRDVAASRANTHYIDLKPLTCEADGSPVEQIDGTRLRSDGVHWTDPGAAYLWAHLLRAVADSRA